MESFDAVIVGGGPAGSSCAWALRDSGLRIAILDKARFPRNKICGGWITPQVLTALDIDPVDYSRGRVLQPITGFRTSIIGGRELESNYGSVVSYGIRRCEFDHYLLARSGVHVFEGVDARSIRRSNGAWVIADRFETRLLIGAGGHFCPVARTIGAQTEREAAVLAQETEFEMAPADAERCPVRGGVPALYFCRDMKGYGWCFRKDNYLNIGLGRLDSHGLPRHVADFLDFLRATGRIPFRLPEKPRGHAYLLYRNSPRTAVADGAMLIGDAAGLAYSQSGEGILPAVESGFLAARCILDGSYETGKLVRYGDALQGRFGGRRPDLLSRVAKMLPGRALEFAARHAVNQSWFAREVILNRWFLHATERTLACCPPPG